MLKPRGGLSRPKLHVVSRPFSDRYDDVEWVFLLPLLPLLPSLPPTPQRIEDIAAAVAGAGCWCWCWCWRMVATRK